MSTERDSNDDPGAQPDDASGPGEIAARVVNTAAQDIGSFIRAQREAAQVSLRQLSQLAGVSNPYLSQIERGLRKPSAEVLAQIAKGLRLSAEVLYVRAGILEERDGADLVEEIRRDADLSEEQKKTLIRIYSSFRHENDLRSGAPQEELADAER